MAVIGALAAAWRWPAAAARARSIRRRGAACSAQPDAPTRSRATGGPPVPDGPASASAKKASRSPRGPKRRFILDSAPRLSAAMHHFAYRDGVLHAEEVNLAALARRGRHAVLLLFHRDAGAALPGVRRAPSPTCRRSSATP